MYNDFTMKTAQAKLRNLENILHKMGGVVVAFSGGVDSTFLLKVARDVLGENVFAVTAQSPTFPNDELKHAIKLARKLRVNYRLIQSDELANTEFISNPVNRCYYCKKELFSKLLEVARERNIPWVADGSNKDDARDYRPGTQAIKELGIRRPLMEADLHKGEIRVLSRKMNLPTCDKPSLACLASRLPYGETITIEKLKKIEQAEKFLWGLGFKQVRVRHHNNSARIEVLPEEISRLLENKIRARVVSKLKQLGYQYVTLDLQGYRTGSMNETLNKADG